LCGHRPSTAILSRALHGKAPKAFKRGTHRIGAPDETLARVLPHAQRMGITRLGNVTGLDRIGIPVSIAVRPNSRSLAVAQGKGLSLSQAMASALMEAIELFHGEDIATRTRVVSFRSLSMEARAVDPELLCGTGLSLPAEEKIPWIEGYDLLRQEDCWVPWEVVHTDYTLSAAHSGRYFLSGTNGLAAGNHMLEALSAAICELVEHDGVALWHASGLVERARCRLDTVSINDDDCLALLAAYKRAGLVPMIWDVTSDIGIPAFVCDIPAAVGDTFGGLVRRFRGAGCHPNRGIALARALTEAAQVRLTYITGNRDDLPPSDYQGSQPEKIGAALLDAASQAAEPRSFQSVPSVDWEDLGLDLRWELQRLRSAGIDQAIAVDLTRPDFQIPVVRMVIPGLEWECSHPQYKRGPRARGVNRRGQ
jgi:YcaO-like protein with predicted kinase domain